jgi:hypothetical protein
MRASEFITRPNKTVSGDEDAQRCAAVRPLDMPGHRADASPEGSKQAATLQCPAATNASCEPRHRR